MATINDHSIVEFEGASSSAIHWEPMGRKPTNGFVHSLGATVDLLEFISAVVRVAERSLGLG